MSSEVTTSPVQESAPASDSHQAQFEAHRGATVPAPKTGKSSRLYKRIILCCDGTWQDGYTQKHKWEYSNITKLARAIHHEDVRSDPPIPQVVFYQTGVGSEQNALQDWVEGATGDTLIAKVQEAYAFIAHNFHPGDEIFCFGFSRGAFTARMVAALIGEIGVLNKRDMDHFADIFMAFQKRGKAQDPKDVEDAKAVLAPYNGPDAVGKKRANPDGKPFSIKCVGVFDTVASVGLPKELPLGSSSHYLFGFPDTILGAHIETALHALALNETRADFDCTKFKQSQEGKDKGQVLKQCWFAGSHSDIGGGWKFHDLSDLTLTWMLANIEEVLAVDLPYVKTLFHPSAPWGRQLPHDPMKGVFSLAEKITRNLPDPVTQEMIHPSVEDQQVVLPGIRDLLIRHPEIRWKLHPFEQEVQKTWNYDPTSDHYRGKEAQDEIKNQNAEENTLLSLARQTTKVVTDTAQAVALSAADAAQEAASTATDNTNKKERRKSSWISSIIHSISGSG